MIVALTITPRGVSGRRDALRYSLHGHNTDGTVKVYGPLIQHEDRWVATGRAGMRNVPADTVREVAG